MWPLSRTVPGPAELAGSAVSLGVFRGGGQRGLGGSCTGVTTRDCVGCAAAAASFEGTHGLQYSIPALPLAVGPLARWLPVLLSETAASGKLVTLATRSLRRRAAGSPSAVGRSSSAESLDVEAVRAGWRSGAGSRRSTGWRAGSGGCGDFGGRSLAVGFRSPTVAATEAEESAELVCEVEDESPDCDILSAGPPQLLLFFFKKMKHVEEPHQQEPGIMRVGGFFSLF